MALAHKQFDALDSAGNLLTNVQVSVEIEGGSIVPLYSDRDGATPIGNPVTFVDGKIDFYCVGGAYKITMTQGSYSRVLRYVAVGTAAEYDFEDFADAYQPLDSDLTAIAALTTTTFGRSLLTKTAAEDVRDSLDTGPYVATRTALKALDTTKDTVAFLAEAGREGMFVWMAGNYASLVTADTAEGIYVKATAIASSAGAWVRVFATAMNVRWFGCKVDASTNDAVAFQAAIDFAKSLDGLYTGGGGALSVPFGIMNVGATIVLTGAHNVKIIGAGDGNTTIKGTGDFPVFQGLDTSGSPLYRFVMADLTIEGPGYTNTSAHGIDLTFNNNCVFQNIRVWACRRGIAYSNAFHTEFINIRMNGQGGLANYDGFYAKDGDPAVVENAVGIFGGRVQGCARYGFRGESVTGSTVYGLEVLGCGSTGVYIGDSPSNKDLKWFSWIGGLVDTCPNLVVVKKGTSTVAEDMHWSGMWLGYASAGGAGGTGVEFVGLNDCSFNADIIVNTEYAANIQDCTRITFRAATIDKYDRLLTGGAAIICNNTTNSRFDIGTTKKTATSPSTVAFVEQGTADDNLVTGVFDGSVTLLNAPGSSRLAMVSGSGEFVNEGIRNSASGLKVSSGGWLGYGTGSGGTVTQATSKSTGVTLSEATGQITMNAAALAANTEVTFTLTNTLIEAADILILNHSLTAKYVVNAVCGAGSAAITVRNVTAGSLSEALVIKFGLLKGATT